MMAYDNGLIPEPTTNALWDGLRGEVAAWRRQNKALKNQVASDEQSKRFQSEVVGNDLASEAVTLSQLKVGDSIVANREVLKVVDFDQDYNMFILDGGKRYGQQSLTPDTTLYVEKVNYAPEGGEVGQGDGVMFSAEDNTSETASMLDVRQRYQNTPQWMKAPNGQPTKLNERQWLQVRTPEFKKWFGDWEASERANKIVKMSAVPVDVSSISEPDAISTYKGIGSRRNDATGIEAEFVNNSLWKIMRHKGFDPRVIRSLGEAFSVALPAFDEPVSHELKGDGVKHKVHTNFTGYSHLVGKVKIGGSEYFVRFTLQNLKTKTKEKKSQFHSAFVSDVTMYESTASGVKSMNNMATSDGGALVDSKLARFLDSVKSVSKVVDANGEPMVVYHGTNAESFNEFRTPAFFGEKERASYGSRGLGRVEPYFIRIVNPELQNWQGHVGVSSSDIRRMKTDGIDGVRQSGGDYVVFDPTQIKSATANTGAFDADNPDIRFSVSERNSPPSELPDHLASAVVATNGKTLKNKPSYDPAKKHGDYDGAVDVANSIIKSSTISEIRSKLHGDAPVYVVPVVNQEDGAEAENQLPIAMAKAIASWLRATVLMEVGKKKTGATKLNARERAIADNGYEGEIPEFGQFILVDDMLTSGNTLYGLYDYLAGNGADVRAFVTGAQTRGAGIRASQEDLDEMHKKSGLDSAEIADILGRHEGYLTGQEVRHYNLTGGRGPSGFAKRFANDGKREGQSPSNGLWASDLGAEAGGEGAGAQGGVSPLLPGARPYEIQPSLDSSASSGSGSDVTVKPGKPYGYTPSLFPSASDIDATDHVLGEREKVLAAAAAARLVAGKDVTPGRIRTMLTGIGSDPGTADTVLKQARAIAAEVKRDNLKLANDADIMEAVTVAAVKGKYRENIRTTAGTATENANRLAEALAKINDWRKHRQEQLAAARGGVGYADIAAQDAALAGLHDRLPSIISDYVPKPKPTKEEETQAGGEESARGGVRSDDAEETPETPTDAFEFPDRAAADQDAEAAALAPIPAELPSEPVAIAKLKDAIKAAVRENLKKIGYTARNEGTDPVFRREYAESWARVLRDAAWANIKAGRLQAWVTEELAVMAKTPGNTANIDKRVSQLAYWIGRATEKAQAETLFARIEKLLRLKAVKTKPSTTKEYIKRDIDPHFHSWLRLVKSVITTRTEGGSPHYTTAEDRESLLQHLTSIGRQWSTGTIEEDVARDQVARLVSPMVATDPMLQSMDVDDMLNTVSRAVSAYAGAKYMKPAELATALDTLQADYESGVQKILAAREERRKRLEPGEESIRAGVLTLTEKQDGVISSFIRGQFSFYRGMLDLVRQAEGEAYDKAAASIRDLSVRIDSVIGEKDSRVAADTKWLHGQIKEAYGLESDKDVETKLRELKEEREEFKRFSLVDNKGKELRLTKANLLSVVAMLQQAHGAEMGMMHAKRASRGARDSAYLASIISELSVQDMELLDRLRGWYRDNRPELSRMSEDVTGVPVTSPDPLYHPIVADRDDAHLAEFHFVLNLVPSALETRRKHKWDIKEDVDIFDTFFKYSEANAQFIAGAQLGQDLRFMFGNPKMRRALKESAGPKTATDLITHVTEIAAGRPINKSTESVSGLMSSVRAMTTYTAMSGSVGSMIRQASAIPAFGYVIDDERPMGAMTEAMTKAFTDTAEWKRMYDIISQHPHFKAWAHDGWSEQVHNAMTQNSKNPIVRLLRMGMAVPAVGIRASALAVAPGILLMRFKEYQRRGMGDEAAMRMALGEVFFAIHQTQGSSHIANLSAPMRGANEGTKLVMQFMGPVIQLLEPELNMWRNLTSGSASSRRQGMNYLVIGHILIPSAYQMANVIFKSMRGDYAGDDGDDEIKKSLMEWMVAMLIGPLSAIYFIGGALESLVRYGAGMRVFTDSAPAVTLVTKLGIGSLDMAKHLATFNYEEAVKDFDKVAKTFALYRDVRKAGNNYSDASDD